MKCPNCGGENNGNYCQFCGSEMPKTVAPVSITNNFFGTNANDQAQSGGNGCCPKCGSPKIGFKRERAGTNAKASSRKKYIGTGRKGTYNSSASYRTIGLCQSCGYTWSPNGATKQVSEQDQKLVLYIFGFVFMFPLSITIILLKNKKLNKWFRYGIIALSWILYFFVFWPAVINAANIAADNKAQMETPIQVQTSAEITSESTTEKTETTLKERVDLGLYIDTVVEAYNKQASEPLVYEEDFVPSDENSGHYRMEFRLNAWSDALGKSYKIGDKTVDIVADSGYKGVGGFRVYADNISIEQVHSLVQGMSPLMDESLSAADLNEALNKVDNDKEANGFYYGKLGMVLLKRSENGYELMIKRD